MPGKYIVNNKTVNKEFVSKIDSLSNILRDYQANLTKDLQSKYPNVDIFGTLDSIAKEPVWSNKKLDNFAQNFIKNTGINPTIKAPEDYIKAAQMYNEMTVGKGTVIPQVGQIEPKLNNFGIRTAAIKYIHNKGENPYRALSNNYLANKQ